MKARKSDNHYELAYLERPVSRAQAEAQKVEEKLLQDQNAAIRTCRAFVRKRHGDVLTAEAKTELFDYLQAIGVIALPELPRGSTEKRADVRQELRLGMRCQMKHLKCEECGLCL